MAITRLFQAHGEYGNSSNFAEWTTDYFGSISGTNPHTGGFSYSNVANVYHRKTLPSVISQGRLGFWFYHNGISSGDSPALFVFRKSGTAKLYVYGKHSDSKFYLNVGGSDVASVDFPAEFATGTWLRMGFDFKVAEAGWAVLYLNGTAILTYEGDTTGAGSNFDVFQMLSSALLNSWELNYFDDLYLDDTAGEATYAPPPDIRFQALYPTGNGSENEFDKSHSNANWEHVDSTSYFSDSYYVYASSAGLNDRYTHDAYAIPDGFQIDAVHYGATLVKTDAGIATTAVLTGKMGDDEYATEELSIGTGGLSKANSGDLIHFDRQTTDPAGAAWTQAALNATEFGVRSAGDYS